MIQIEILNGSKAGTRWVARRFPFVVGREKQASVNLADDGVWEGHLELSVRPGLGCFVAARPEALTLVNGLPVAEAVRLRNGDVIEAGSVRLRFGLSPTRQSSSAWPEGLVWAGIVLLCLGQIALIYFVLP